MRNYACNSVGRSVFCSGYALPRPQAWRESKERGGGWLVLQHQASWCQVHRARPKSEVWGQGRLARSLKRFQGEQREERLIVVFYCLAVFRAVQQLAEYLKHASLVIVLLQRCSFTLTAPLSGEKLLGQARRLLATGKIT